MPMVIEDRRVGSTRDSSEFQCTSRLRRLGNVAGGHLFK